MQEIFVSALCYAWLIENGHDNLANGCAGVAAALVILAVVAAFSR